MKYDDSLLHTLTHTHTRINIVKIDELFSIIKHHHHHHR